MRFSIRLQVSLLVAGSVLAMAWVISSVYHRTSVAHLESQAWNELMRQVELEADQAGRDLDAVPRIASFFAKSDVLQRLAGPEGRQPEPQRRAVRAEVRARFDEVSRFRGMDRMLYF